MSLASGIWAAMRSGTPGNLGCFVYSVDASPIAIASAGAGAN